MPENALREALAREGSTDAERSLDVVLSGGNDGIRPTADEYEGKDDPKKDSQDGSENL